MNHAHHTVLGSITGVLLASAPVVVHAQQAAAASSDAAMETEPVGAPERDGRAASSYSYEDGGLAGAGLVAGVKAGAGIGVGAFGSTPVLALEVGYLLPPLRRSLELFVSGQYAGPKTEAQDLEDTYALDGASRLPGTASYEITERQAVLTLGVLYRVPLELPRLRPYAGLGGRLYMTEAVIDARAGEQEFGENRETDMQPGFFGALGLEAYLGPGAALLELELGHAKVDGYVLRHANATALDVTIGYRLFI